MENINEQELSINDRKFIDTRVININQNYNNSNGINNCPENLFNPARKFQILAWPGVALA